MYELTQQEIDLLSAGVGNLTMQAALSTLTGTLIGGTLGTAFALNLAMPTASLFPIWVASCTGAGGAIGSLIGIAYGLCPRCSN